MKQPNRITIKEEAKKLIKGNIYTLIKPTLIMFATSFIVGIINGLFFTKTVPCSSIYGVCTEVTTVGEILELILYLCSFIFSVGLARYMLKFVRGETFNIKEDFLYYFKNNAWKILLTGLLMSIFIFLWSLLLIIPAIIAIISYTFVTELLVDTGKTGKEVITESVKLTEGHKGNYFVFVLSFIGWFLLGAVTFGLAYIYVIPYFNTAHALYYEELKKIEK